MNDIQKAFAEAKTFESPWGARQSLPPMLSEAPRPLRREMDPAEPFPMDDLGDILEPAARAIQEKVQAPLALCGQSVLAVATLSVQGHADVELPTGQARPVSGIYVTVAATGERKSACDLEAHWPNRKPEQRLQ